MTWVRLDDDFRHHPKAVHARARGRDLYVSALGHAKKWLTDGFIPDDVVPQLLDPSNQKDAKSILARMLVPPPPFVHGLFERDEARGGYLIHDYAEHNLTRDELADERAAAAQRQRDKRGRSRQVTQPSQRDTTVTASPVTPPVPENTRARAYVGAGTRARSESESGSVDLSHTHIAVEIAKALPDLADDVEGLLSDLEFTFGPLDFAQLAREAALYRKTAPGAARMSGADVLRRFCSTAKARGAGKGAAVGRAGRSGTTGIAAAVERIQDLEDFPEGDQP